MEAAMHNELAGRKAARLVTLAEQAGLAPVRVDAEAGGYAILLSARRERYVELQVDPDGHCCAIADGEQMDGPAWFGLPWDLVPARLACLRRFVSTGAFSLDA